MGSAALFGDARGDGMAQDYLSSSPYSPQTAYNSSMASDATDDLLLFGGAPDSAFATSETLGTCSKYLEPILRDLGLRQWQLADGDAVAAVNCLYDLVQQHQRVQEAREAAQDEAHKAKVDVKVASKSITRLQGQLEAKQQELGALNIKLRQLDAWYREETDRWTNEREEMVKKCSQLEHKHTQFQHELRRRDTEFERLQKHLAQQIAATERRRRVSSCSGASSSSGNSSTMVLSSFGSGSFKQGRGAGGASVLGRASGGTPTGSGSSSQAVVDTKRMAKAELEDLYKRSVEAFEAEKQGLQLDNAALRKALHSLEREHKDLLNKAHTGSRSSGAGNSSSSDCKPSTGLSALAAGTTATADCCSSGDGSSPTAAAAQAASLAAHPAAALHRMHNNLQALKVRKQRVTGSTPLSDLQQQAESASERLLLAKLNEASRIMEEQESALALALKAIGSGSSTQGS